MLGVAGKEIDVGLVRASGRFAQGRDSFKKPLRTSANFRRKTMQRPYMRAIGVLSLLWGIGGGEASAQVGEPDSGRWGRGGVFSPFRSGSRLFGARGPG